MKRLLLLFFGSIGVVIALYVGTYYAVVERVRTTMPTRMVGPEPGQVRMGDDLVFVSHKYRIDNVYVEAIFEQMLRFDKMVVRPDFWK